MYVYVAITMDFFCYQLNLHNSYLAQKELLSKMSQYKNPIAFLQELPTPKGKLIYPKCSTHLQHNKNQRATLYIPKHLDFCQINSLTTPLSMAACGKLNNQFILLVSLYIRPKAKTLPDILPKIISYAKQHKLPTIIAGDLNIHSQLWGSDQSKTNYLSQDMEEFIIQNNINVLNNTSAPTFRNSRDYTSHVDVTLTFQLDSQLEIKNWFCHDKVENFSDHNTITFNINNVIPAPPVYKRHWNKAKWETFTKALSLYEYYTPDTITQKALDDMVDDLYVNLHRALELACPAKPTQPKKDTNKWPAELQKQRLHINDLYKKQNNNPTKINIKTYEEEKSIFRNAAKKWQNQCELDSTLEINSIKEASQYYKNLTHSEINIGVLQDLSFTPGRETSPGVDTIKLLYKQHFPSHTPVKETVYSPFKQVNKSSLEHLYRDDITITKIKRAFKGFDTKKSPGPDGLKPIVLQHLPPKTMNQILIIYKACIALHFTPTKWKATKVIFIPKNDKPHYEIPKNFRPISLANYLLKTLERLLGWHMNKQLKTYPIHANQHGFCSNKGTESAISAVTSYIESFTLKNQHCIGVSLDIQAAFDSICPQAIKQALTKHGGQKDLIMWYYNYLTHRNIETELNNETSFASNGVGFPQGRVVSAYFWKIVFDPALSLINNDNTTGFGYADDLIILRGGLNANTSINQLQVSINRLITWGAKCKLQFNSNKIKVVLFNKKKLCIQHK